MRVTLESTSKIVTIVVDGKEVPARIWEGVTAKGVPCHAYITRILVHKDEDNAEFERDLQEHRPPSPEIDAAIPNRFVV